MSNSLKVIIDFIVLAILYVVVFFNKWRTRGKAKLVVNTLMYIYIVDANIKLIHFWGKR